MRELARCNGTRLVADGDTVGIVDRGGGWIGPALFVLGLVGALTTLGGAALATANLGAGAGMLALGVACIAGALALRARRRRAEAGASPAPWLVFDRAAGVVRDAQGRQLCTLAQVRLERVFQAGSSSKALAAYVPGKVVIARGTPFGDEVDALEAALRDALGR